MIFTFDYGSEVVDGLFFIPGLVIFTFDNGSKWPYFSIVCGYCVTSTKFYIVDFVVIVECC